ncbi:hypothetical protein ACIQW5_29240 [Methylorubrum thiocyanatum]|uniref:hypothetical protein n=1 Tax=Methylorubrum thiocyanatum TaxID=47958 RepID=UPI00383A8656
MTDEIFMPEALSADLLILIAENAELRLQLAELQDQLVETAVDAGELHIEIQTLRAQLAAVEHERDDWRAEATGIRGRAIA